MNIPSKVSQEANSLINQMGGGDRLEEVATNSYLLAASLEQMFGSGQYFQGKAQIESLSTAVEAAKDARDNVVSVTKSRTSYIDTSGVTENQVVQEYSRNAVASTLMVLWCAHGLTGMSKFEAAQEVFRTPVSQPDVRSWDSFKKILMNECRGYL